MIALLFFGTIVFFGDAVASRWFRYVSLPHRLASGFLVGLLIATWLAYLAALIASRVAADPMAVGSLASMFAMLATGVWLHKHPPRIPQTPWRQLRSSLSDWLLVIGATAAVGAMMIWTFHYDQGTLWIAGDLWSDFGPTSAISQSFASGRNFPTEYPHFAGEPIRYHFLYYFQVGNLTYLGLDPATANNLVSITSVVALLVVVYALGERLFESRAVGWIAVAFFFLHGSLSFIPYLAGFPSLLDGLAATPNLDHFLASGFPYRGEEWGIWTQDAYLNQRHLPSAIGLLLVIVAFLMDRLPSPALGPADPGWIGVQRRLVAGVSTMRSGVVRALRRPVGVAVSAARDPYLPGFLLCGLLAGLLPYYNGALFIAAAVVFGLFLVMFPNRTQMLALGLTSAVVAVPQLLNLRPGTMAGEQTYPTFFWGYTVTDPTPVNVAAYLAFIFGPKLFLASVGLVLGGWRRARLFLAFAALVVVAFTVQVSLEVFANHKFIHGWLIVANLFAAYGLIRVWRARSLLAEPVKLVANILVVVILAGGIIDLFPIKNQRMYQVGVDGDPLVEWVRAETRPNDVFLSDLFVVHGILLAGREVYLGWQYYSWSAGYDVRTREETYQALFAEQRPQALAEMLQREGIDYVAIDDGLRERGFVPELNEAVYQGNFELAFNDTENRYGHLAIYRVPEAATAP